MPDRTLLFGASKNAIFRANSNKSKQNQSRTTLFVQFITQKRKKDQPSLFFEPLRKSL